MFEYTFQITKKIIFEVRYNDLSGANREPDFATSCAVFNQPKTDFDRCGQCQADVLPKGKARNFWEKWDNLHLHKLDETQEEELLLDVEELKAKYNWCAGSGFCEQRELSKMNLKKSK